MGDFDTVMSRVLVIIAAEHVASARALLEVAPFNQTPEQAAGTFVAAGSATGEVPATHWWLSAEVSETSLAACRGLCEQLPWAECHEYDLRTEPGRPLGVLADLGLQPMRPVM